MRTRRSRKSWPVIGAAAGVLAGVVLHGLQPAIYEASTTILVIPQRVPEEIVRPAVTTSLGERLNIITQQILSRTRLERVVQEFNLYERERAQMIMEDVIAQMRSDISLNVNLPADNTFAPSFAVSFKSPDARTAMRVTERLASLFVVENIEDRALLADQTNQFLQGQLDEARRRLIESQRMLESMRREALRPLPEDFVLDHELVQETYRSLFRKNEDAKLAVNLERRQIGEQFKVIDGARLPERPIGPGRLPYLIWGALAGFAASFLLMRLSSMWRRRREPAPVTGSE